MRKIKGSVKGTLKRFRSVKVMTIKELMETLGCANSTVHRYLKNWNCLTSYNRNSRYYALPEIVEFDSDGLWCHNGIRFSRYGSLGDTVTGLIGHSPAGLTSGELGAAVGLNPHTFLSVLQQKRNLYREKTGGSYVYFSEDPAAREKQKSARLEMLESGYRFTDAETVSVLAELVRHPDADSRRLCELLRPTLPDVSPGAVEKLLGNLGLLKKTADSKS
jgi:hypothetical protein